MGGSIVRKVFPPGSTMRRPRDTRAGVTYWIWHCGAVAHRLTGMESSSAARLRRESPGPFDPLPLMSSPYPLQDCADRYARTHAAADRAATVTAGQALVRAIVSRTTAPTHVLADREDLESLGMLGLLQALDQYDPDRGTPFASFAYGRIRGVLVDHIRSLDPLSREQRRRLATAHEAAERIRQTTGAEPLEDAIAEATGFDAETLRGLAAQAQGRFALSLDSAAHDDDGATRIDSLPCGAALDAFDAFDRRSDGEHLACLIRTLAPREQEILALYYYEDLTLREIAGLMGVTEARISQILGKTLRGLRARFVATDDTTARVAAPVAFARAA